MEAKIAGEEFMYHMQITKTYPEPYNLHDGNWHKVQREYMYIYTLYILDDAFFRLISH